MDQAGSDPSRWKFSSQYLRYWGVSCHIWRIIRVHQYSGSIYNVHENLKSNYENTKIAMSPDANIRWWIDISGINRRVWRYWKLETSVNMAYPRQVSPCSEGPDGSYNCECSNLIIGNFQSGLKLLQSLHLGWSQGWWSGYLESKLLNKLALEKNLLIRIELWYWECHLDFRMSFIIFPAFPVATSKRW